MTLSPSHRSIFDIDTIDLGPERRSYLEHKLERVWEINSQVCGGVSDILEGVGRQVCLCLSDRLPAPGQLLIAPQLRCLAHERACCHGGVARTLLPGLLTPHACSAPFPIHDQGSIPYVPYLRAPYYVWVGQHHQTGRECDCGRV